MIINFLFLYLKSSDKNIFISFLLLRIDNINNRSYWIHRIIGCVLFSTCHEKNPFHQILLRRLYCDEEIYTLWISRCIATARERIPGSIDNYVTGVSAANKEAT